MTSLKKNGFELVQARAALLASFQGPLPDYCCLPHHYRLDFSAADQVCACGTMLTTCRTKKQQPRGLMLGEPLVTYHIKRCPSCHHTYRFDPVAELKPRYSNYLFDCIVAIGLSRFVQHRPNQEISRELKQRYGLSLPLTTINDLAEKFLDYFAAIHELRGACIRDYLTRQGGYILHLDGTCEAGTDIFFAAFDGLSGWILDCGKMPTENRAQITLFLQRIISHYGEPEATVSDLSPNIGQAISAVLPTKPHLICHYHFLVTVGEKLFDQHYALLSKHLRRYKIHAALTSLRKDLRRYAKGGRPITKKELGLFLEQSDLIRSVEPRQAQRCLTYLLLKWFDDYKHDLQGEYYPFDLPNLALYRRGVALVRLIDQIVAPYQLKAHQWQSLKTIRKHLQPLLLDRDLRRTAHRLEKAEQLFLQLRQVLRLASSKNKPVLRQNAGRGDHDHAAMQQQLRDFRAALEDTIEQHEDHDRCVDALIVEKYLEKYWSKLLGNALSPTANNIMLLVERTNNIAERCFAVKKKKLRQKNGTKKLNRNIQAMRAEEFLVENLHSPEYVKLIYGELENIKDTFVRYKKTVEELAANSSDMKIDQDLPMNKTWLRKRDFLDRLTLCARELIDHNYASA